jgi:hypothetical protein
VCGHLRAEQVVTDFPAQIGRLVAHLLPKPMTGAPWRWWAPESALLPFPCARQRRWARVGAGTVAGTAPRHSHRRPTLTQGLRTLPSRGLSPKGWNARGLTGVPGTATRSASYESSTSGHSSRP